MSFGAGHFGTRFGPPSRMEEWLLGAPETRLLLLAGRPTPPDDLDDLVAAAIDAGIDWQTFVGLARSHRLTPHVGRNLRLSEVVPDDVRPAFERMVDHTTRRGLVSAGALRKIIVALEEAGIPALPMKGPALSAWLYDDVTRRVFVDLDVLVDPSDIAAAIAVVEDLGFGPVGEEHRLTPAEAQVAIEAFYIHEVHYWHPELRVKLELHWIAFNDPSYRAIDREVQELVHVDPASRDRGVLGAHVLVHGAHHAYKRLCWLLDAGELCRALDAEGWSRAIDLAAADHVVNTVLFGPYLAHRCFGSDVPAEVAGLIEDRLPIMAALADASQVRNPDESGIEQPGALRVQTMLRDRRRDRLRFLATKLVRPSRPDMNPRTLRPGWRGRLSRLRIQIPRWGRFIGRRVIPRRIAGTRTDDD